jgi:hypothetical protein
VGHPFDAKKAFFYGKFVQAAYEMFEHPGSDPLRPEPVGVPEGYEVGAWIHMSDFILNFNKPEFYGIVAHEISHPDSRVIAIRGTEGALEWIDDAMAIPKRFRQVPSAGRVACGFDRIYSSLKVVKRRLAVEGKAAAPAVEPETYEGSFGDQLESLARSREAARGVTPAEGEKRRPRPTVVAGHSLGAALATLFVMENSAKQKFDIGTCCTFASPRVGTAEFARAFDQLSITSWRVVNRLDLVPKLPLCFPVWLDYEHVETEQSFESSGFAKKSLLCYHVLETYLHWLDGSYPLRPVCEP